MTWKPLLFLCIALSLTFCTLGDDDLRGWKVVNAVIEQVDDIKIINSWDLDVWSHDSNLIVGSNHIRVNDEQLAALEDLGIKYEVMVPDVQVMLDEMAKGYVNETAADWFASYHTFDEFNTYLTNLTTTFPTLIKKTNVGQSIQGRNIDAYVITGTATGTKKKILWTGLQHAREWISPHTVVFQFTQLVTLYSSNPTVKRYLDNIVFHIIPIINPDGYVYTWTGSSARLWRKNRRANAGGSYGVDLNRNWDDHWGGDGSSGTPTSDTYRGTAPFSEPESKVVSNYILQNTPFAGYIDFHSYSQLVLRPYGWTNVLPPDSAAHKIVGDQISRVILGVHGKSYTSEPAYQLYYTSGTADDWGYTKAKIKYTYTIELRDTGTYGFQLPANQIVPTGQEIWAAMQYYIDYIIANN
jgi:murein tripeptide amidase MpaA